MSRYDEYVSSNDTPKDLCAEIDKLRAELEEGKKRWAYFDARFVKCSDCNAETMKNCLMHTEMLCEGERCFHFEDLEALLDKSPDLCKSI